MTVKTTPKRLKIATSPVKSMFDQETIQKSYFFSPLCNLILYRTKHINTMQLTISTEQRITNTLLLNASFIGNIGLLNGKMGISICFFHLARQTGIQIYEDY